MKVDKDWKIKIDNLGKDHFERIEMLRLGFWKPENEKNIDKAKEQKNLDELYLKVSQHNQKVNEINKELNKVDIIEKQISEVRSLRIKRSQNIRAQRKKQKLKDKSLQLQKYTDLKNEYPLYVGKGISSGLNFKNHNTNKLKKNKLPIIHKVSDLAKEVGVKGEFIRWLCFHKEVANFDHYERFKIKKRNGNLREISSPKRYLRKMQSWIKENILEILDLNESATAYRKGSNICQNAIPHLAQHIVVKIDLKDFFFSVSFSRVRGFFHSLGYSSGIATLFALICTDCQREKIEYRGKTYFVAQTGRRLQQGAITSPLLSNLIAQKLDSRIIGASKAIDKTAKYTRYADDLAISFNKNFSDKFLRTIRQIIDDENFVINPSKFKIMRGERQKVITGIRCNGKKLQVPKKYLRNLRAEIHNAKLQFNEKQKIANHSSIEGKIRHVININKAQIKKLGDINFLGLNFKQNASPRS